MPSWIRIRGRFSIPFALAAVLVWSWAFSVRGQEARTQAIPDLQAILQRGDELERDGKWGDALNHYEDAIKSFPNTNVLERRLGLSKSHYDIARRYSDSGYVAAVRATNEQQALEVYGEILLKIHTHFVNAPNWQNLVRHGATNVDLALTERPFIGQFAGSLSSEGIDVCRQEIRRILESRTVANRYDARMVAQETARVVQDHLRIPSSVTILEFTCAAANSLDDYSSFLTGQQLDEVFSQIDGNFVGLGVELKAEQQSLLIVNVIAGGPAERSGIRAGDRIVGVDGRLVRDVSPDAAADMLRGPEGSRVSVVIADSQGARRTLVVERMKVEVPCVDRVRIIEPANGIAYARLTSFQKSTSRDIDQALWTLHRQEMKLLILDLRGNPGGLLNAAVEVADKFISNGTIVSTRGRNSKEDADYKAHGPGTWRVPLIVLIDSDSASASEIFAAAIRDHRRGTVVGERSYGKGSVQGIFPLNASNAGIRLTTAKFFSPSGQPISGRGVSPDIQVQNTLRPRTDGQAPLDNGLANEPSDTVLNAAVNVARNQLSRR